MLELRIGDTVTTIGVVEIIGAADLAGTISALASGSYSPAANDTFAFLMYSSYVGAFDSVLGNGFTYTTLYVLRRDNDLLEIIGSNQGLPVDAPVGAVRFLGNRAIANTANRRA